MGRAPLERRSELPLETIVGRDREVEEVLDLLRATLFVTITGLGGSGKSRLAAEVLRRWQAEGGAVATLDLAPLDSPSFLAPEVSRVLGIPDEPGLDPAALVAQGVADWSGLLLLDNAEELAGIGPAVRDWLAAAPGLVVLVTSRVELALGAEQVYPLAPLAVPAASDPQAVERSPSGALFLREARRLGALRTLTPDDAAAIGEICRRVGGMPLSVQLAAARTALLSPVAIARRLGGPAGSDGFGGLDGVLAWTLGLLDADDRARLLQLSVIPGAFDLALVEAAWGVDPVDTLQRLARLALIRPAPGEGERWEMLVPVREFLVAELRASGAEAEAMDRLAAFVTRLFPDPRTTSPIGTGAWIASIAERHDVVRGVVDWQAEHDPGAAVATMWGLRRYWLWSRWSWEGRERIRALNQTPDLPLWARVRALCTLVMLEEQVGGPDGAINGAIEAEGLARELGDPELLMHAVMLLAVCYGELDEFDLEWPKLQEALDLARAIGDRSTEVKILNNLALHLMERGRLDEADAWATEALAAGRGIGDEASEVQAICDLAEIASLRGHHEDALRYAEQGFAMGTSLGSGLMTARIAAARLQVAVAAGATDVALAALDDAARLSVQTRGWGETARTIDASAWLLIDFGRFPEAARLIGLANRVRAAANVEGDRDPRLIERLPRLRQVLGGTEFDRLADEGARGDLAATLDSLPVIVRAGARVASTKIRARFGTLSAREREVLAMVARGATDPEIARALGIAAKTASVHVANLKRKLGVETRIDLALEGRRLLDDAAAG